ncbi:unnamed protein product [Cuscuta epithymum]|uniref:Plastid division regulator MinE n=1 Tax=Cuscuta epithymum TaxID=186058 RepID=A0AAV0CUV7_9ASTE|nr:unnamed protein product [Cuscuta epithymum]
MAVSGAFRVSAAFGPHPNDCLRSSMHPTPPSKVCFGVFFKGGFSTSELMLRGTQAPPAGHNMQCHSVRTLGDSKQSSNSTSQEFDNFLLNITNMGFLERISLAWKVLFPPPPSRKDSNANIAKQRLKMILFSDRCAVSDEAKQKIVSNIVSVLSDFVEIESQDNVQLSVSTDPDLGTIYSITVPVRRVRSEYQVEDPTGTITSIEYKDTGENSGSIDVKFDFYTPDEN